MTNEEISQELYHDDGNTVPWGDVPDYIKKRYREIALEIVVESENEETTVEQ